MKYITGVQKRGSKMGLWLQEKDGARSGSSQKKRYFGEGSIGKRSCMYVRTCMYMCFRLGEYFSTKEQLFHILHLLNVKHYAKDH